MFEKILVENEVKDWPSAQRITSQFNSSEVIIIENIEHYFGKYKKPYLQKRTNLNLYLGKKRGTLIKPAPDAYGLANEPHYYFIHSYNCIYECQYCYLQGYFHSPDIVLFLNHEEIAAEIISTISQYSRDKNVWFHAGEFSDSLALSHLSQEYEPLFKVFYEFPNAKLELRTKSANIKEILKHKPSDNIIISFSLSPEHRIKKTELKTPSLKVRLEAMKKLKEHSYPLAIHLDPIIWDVYFPQSYEQLIDEIDERVGLTNFKYISLGVVRFTKEALYQVERNYPESDLLAHTMIKSYDNKVRYFRPMRLNMMNQVKAYLTSKGYDATKVYLCMEKNQE